MSLAKRIKLSRFILSCVFLTGYSAYTVYAVYYYTRYEDSRIGTILLCLIGAALALSIFITIVSYRINLMDKARPKLHRFVKMTKYLFQLVISSVSVPFLLWSFFVNVFAELLEHALGGFGKKVYVPQPVKDEDGKEVDVRTVIANIDGTANTVKQMKKRQSAPKV